MAENEAGVVELVDAGVPADQGLSSLGLLMLLAGNVLAAYAGLVLIIKLQVPHGVEPLWLTVILGGAVARSLFHRAAGSQLLYAANDQDRTAGVRRYIGFALVHTVVVAAVLAFKLDTPGRLLLGVVGGLALWPLALVGLLALPRFRRFKRQMPLTEDKGFEGASILMTVLGLCGLLGAGAMLMLILDLPGKLLTKGPGVLIVLAVGMLLVRSVLHTQAGLAGLRETSVDRSVELANRYANFGVITAFSVAGALLMVGMTEVFPPMMIGVIAAICWMLMAWPMIIRRFFSDRQFADLLAGEQAPLHRRAPDAGLTSLGWLLVGHAALNASFLTPQLISGSTAGLSEVLALGGALGVRSMWWNVGLVVLQAWAGYELVRMSPQSRVIATVFGAVGAAVTLYVSWPIIDVIKQMFASSPRDALAFAPLAIQLIVPVATIVLVNRKIAPTARARFKQRN